MGCYLFIFFFYQRGAAWLTCQLNLICWCLEKGTFLSKWQNFGTNGGGGAVLVNPFTSSESGNLATISIYFCRIYYINTWLHEDQWRSRCTLDIIWTLSDNTIQLYDYTTMWLYGLKLYNYTTIWLYDFQLNFQGRGSPTQIDQRADSWHRGAAAPEEEFDRRSLVASQTAPWTT